MAEQEKIKIVNKSTYHPLHPAVVHFPIAIYPMSSLFLILWVWLDNIFYLHTAYWSFMLAVITVIPVLLTGIFDFQHVEVENRQSRKLLSTHIILGAVIGIISIVSGIYYLINKPMSETSLIPGFMVISFLLTLMLFVQGFIGGLMVYTHRMGVQHGPTVQQ